MANRMKKHASFLYIILISCQVLTEHTLDDIERKSKNLDINLKDVFEKSVAPESPEGLTHNVHHMNQHFMLEMSGLIFEPLPIMTSIRRNMDSILHSEHRNITLRPQLSNAHWEEFKENLEKSYSSPELEMAARHAWRKNIIAISEHNRAHLAGKHSYSLEINPFTDLSVMEFMKKILRLTKGLSEEQKQNHTEVFHRSHNSGLPQKVDWRKNGYRPRMERQSSCGSCYAFTIAHALQAQLLKKHGDWRDLSAQQIVDCSSIDGNLGCHGGTLRATLKYITREGLEYEKDYQYHAKLGMCHRNPFIKKVRPQRWAMIKKGDEEDLARAVAQVGPVAVSIDASKKTFQLYRSGIYDDPKCSNRVANHAVLVVGYDKDYWIIMNWWGKRWGENGYMRMRRGTNKCGIANIAAYVQL